MDAFRTRRAAARSPLVLTTAAFALASAAGAAAQAECTGGNAIGISLDGSGSIGSTVFGTVSDQIAAFIDSTSGVSSGSANDNLYYANIYSSSIRDTTGSFMTNAGGAVADAVEALPYPGGGTNIVSGIDDLTAEFKTLPAGGGAARIAIVFTDGQDFSELAPAANALRGEGVTVAAVGIGGGVSMDNLEEIASERADGSEIIFTSENFDDLASLFSDAIRSIDSDGDGVDDCADACPEDPDKAEPGECGCGVPEGCNDADDDAPEEDDPEMDDPEMEDPEDTMDMPDVDMRDMPDTPEPGSYGTAGAYGN